MQDTRSRSSSQGDVTPPSAGMSSRRGSEDLSQLQLQVLDVTSTAVALSVFTPSSLASASEPSADSSIENSSSGDQASRHVAKPPTISIQLDGRPWPHVAHAGSASVDSVATDQLGRRGSETTVIVYNLDPGRDYEISLDVVNTDEAGESEHQIASIQIETGVNPEGISMTTSRR